MVSLLLPAFPDFASTFPKLNSHAIGVSFGALSGQLGIVAAGVLVALWLHAIAKAGTRGWQGSIIRTTVGGALATALILVLAGAVTRFRIEPGWFAVLGILIGLAETKPARDGDRRLPHTL